MANPLATAVLAAWLLAGAWVAPHGDVVPVEGPRFQGQLLGVDAGWGLQLAVDGEMRELPAAELVAWGAPAPPRPGAQLLLPDGGLLVGRLIEADQDALVFESHSLGRLTVPLEMLAGILFRPPADVQQRDMLAARVAASPRDSDRLLLNNGDDLAGTVSALNGDHISLESNVGAIEVDVETVAAVAFDPSLILAPTQQGLRAMVGLADGSRIVATAVELNGEQAQLTTSAGDIWAAPAEQVVWLQPLGGQVTYLSDLEPDGYRHVPFLSLAWDYRGDRSVQGLQLRAGGRTYAKGLGMHSASRLTYELRRPYRRFEADVAIDDSVGNRGSVVFRVFLDGQERYASPVMRGGMPPHPISVDVSGAARISLIVDFADRGDELDHADWLDARLVD